MQIHPTMNSAVFEKNCPNTTTKKGSKYAPKILPLNASSPSKPATPFENQFLGGTTPNIIRQKKSKGALQRPFLEPGREGDHDN